MDAASKSAHINVQSPASIKLQTASGEGKWHGSQGERLCASETLRSQLPGGSGGLRQMLEKPLGQLSDAFACMCMCDNVYVSMHEAAGDYMTQGPFTGQNECLRPSPRWLHIAYLYVFPTNRPSS